MQRLAVVGAGGFAGEVLALVEAVNAAGSRPRWELVGVYADWAPDPDFLSSWELPHLGPVSALGTLDPEVLHVVAVGDPQGRRMLVDTIGPDREAAVLTHPTAAVGRHVGLAPGTIVCSHASITTHVSVGRHVQVHAGAVIGHDSVLGDFATVSPGAVVSGRCGVGEGAFLGAGAILNPRVKVGPAAVVGSGAVVLNDVDPAVTVVGVPARPVG